MQTNKKIPTFADQLEAELTTMEVGSQGMLADSDLDALREAIDAPRKEFTGLCLLAIRTAILGSFGIWCSRNCII